jgi:hypothetical protein
MGNRIARLPPDSPGPSSAVRRIVPAMVGATVFAADAALYLVGDRALYIRVIAVWGVVPFDFPFVDTDGVLSALRCRRFGIDVFATNPCDVLGRMFNYSPFWLAASGLPVTPAWTAPIGLGLNLCFLASLLLPAGRDWWATGIISMGIVSTDVVFATERGNVDLVIFALAACAATLVRHRQGRRLLAYGLALLAGLLKYYPLVLMALATRERPRMFTLVALAAAATLAVFVAMEWHDLARALALIPSGPPTGNMFGVRTTIDGFTERYRWSPGTALSVELILLTGASILGCWLGGTRLRPDLAALTESERAFLLAGALLVLGCFLTARNIGYRAVLLLLLLPGVTALWRVGRRRAMYGLSAGVLLLLLWSEGWRNWLSQALERPIPGTERMRFAGWLLREAGWWWIVTLLVALTTELLLRSEMGHAAAAWLARRRARSKAAE